MHTPLTRRAFAKGAAASVVTAAVAGRPKIALSETATGSLTDVTSLPHSEIGAMSARDMSLAFESGKLSPVEVVRAMFERIDAANPHVNAYYYLDRAGAVRHAEAAHSRWRAGVPLSELDGVPVAVKDQLDVEGMPTSWASSLNSDKAPAETDEDIVANARAAGMVILGKTNMNELAMFVTSHATAYKMARNPWNLAKTTGGSSAGASAAAAAGLGPIHIGADGGGSIRIPASHCGVFGFTTSKNRLPVSASNVAHTVYGPITRSVEDAAMAMTVLGRRLAHRSDVLAAPTADYADGLFGLDLSGLKIAYQPFVGMGPRPRQAVVDVLDKHIAALRTAGLQIDDLDPTMEPLEKQASIDLALRYFIGSGWKNTYGDEDYLRAHLSDPLIKYGVDVFHEGHDFDAVAREFSEAVAIRSEALANEKSNEYDLVLQPTMPHEATDLDEVMPVEFRADAEAQGVRWDNIHHTWLRNLNGNCACSLPGGFTEDGLPVGLQVYAKPGRDLLLMRAAAAIESILPAVDQYPMG